MSCKDHQGGEEEKCRCVGLVCERTAKMPRSPVPGSKRAHCHKCGAEVWASPRTFKAAQREAAQPSSNGNVVVVCRICIPDGTKFMPMSADAFEEVVRAGVDPTIATAISIILTGEPPKKREQ